MTTLTLIIIAVFVAGYACIALEHITKVNKAAVALFMFVACWTLLMISPEDYITLSQGESAAGAVGGIMERYLGATATTLFFLMGAMTIVEVVDQNGGFDFVRSTLQTKNKRYLLWRIAVLTFFLSAVLDNMTTSIVMVMVLRKLVKNKFDRMVYASLVIIAANAGGAFSPIGDVTTIMLWNMNLITAAGVIVQLFVPSVVSMVVPALLLQPLLKGNLEVPSVAEQESIEDFSAMQRKVIFAIGVGGLIFVPIFKSITHLPPYVGILLVLSVLWMTTEIFYARLKHKIDGDGMKKRVSNLLSRIDMSTILFFLGILMAVCCLEEIGVLTALGTWLNNASDGNYYLVTGAIGVLSSIVDNVPLVAGCIGMYPLAPSGDMAVDGLFWQLLAYCAGVGGSMLIIGSAAGVVVMGLEKITFGWYLKHITWVAFIGYAAGLLCYWLMRTFIFI